MIATEEPTDPQRAALAHARAILGEHFEVGFIVVTQEEDGRTIYTHAKWGNEFAIAKLAEDYVDGTLERKKDPDDDDDEEEEFA